MNKQISVLYSLILSSAFILTSLPLQAWDWCGADWFSDITTEVRIGYYSPSSHKVRRIYGEGWADYQLEISKGIGYNFRVWTGVSGFSRKGDSIGSHHDTTLDLIPLSFGLKYDYPLGCDMSLFIGGAVCYSFLSIRDHSDYVHEHTHKEDWGGLLQSGLSYSFCDWGKVSLFFDYFFQKFDFHDTHRHSSDGYHGDRYIERSTLDLSGYKVGVGLGLTF